MTVSGNDLVVKFGDSGLEELIACSTSCTLDLAQATIEATCKDAGQWASAIVGEKSWSVTTDALYQANDADGTGGFVDLSTLIIDGPNKTSVVFGGVNSGENIWTGEAIMTACSLTGAANDKATYTATFTGVGPLVASQITP